MTKMARGVAFLVLFIYVIMLVNAFGKHHQEKVKCWLLPFKEELVEKVLMTDASLYRKWSTSWIIYESNVMVMADTMSLCT